MASQRQTGPGRAAGGKTAGDRSAAPRNKAEAGKAQARAARAAAAEAAQAGQGGKASAAAEAAGPELPPAAPWLVWTSWILSLIGLGVSVYLTIEHFTSNSLAGCPETSGVNCTKVTTSPESMVFGVLPVAVLGLAFYVFLAVANSPWAWRWNTLRTGSLKLPSARAIRVASLVVGIGFVLYLVYAELFQIDAICLYCTSVHVITFILFCLIVFDATFRNAPPAANAPGRRR
ncbi:MAG TPA: vitamin K epoxide reductase family protein [Streptosporangiaceae bacterium]|nr:vitamin K epoxide reductase family protein [Streptosporangiaceae bacterium]